MKFFLKTLVLSCAMLAVAAQAQDEVPSRVLLTNVSVWDGTSDKVSKDTDVLVEGNKIKKIGKNLDSEGAIVIDGKGGTVTPGLIDMHQHLTLNNGTAGGNKWDAYVQGAHASRAAEYLLRSGFTTVRDIAGNSLGIKRAVNSGQLPGPRIYSSGPAIGPTGGHSDWGSWVDGPGAETYQQKLQNTMVVDGETEWLRAGRWNFRMGADFLKVMSGGGVASEFDPIDLNSPSLEEMKAAVDVAKTWNTYVAAHIFTDDAVQTALRAGVMSIEHGFLIEKKETWQMMKKVGAWLSIQPLLDDEDALKFDNPYSQEKFSRVTAGTDNAYTTAKKMGINIAFGTDMLFDPVAAEKQGKMLSKLSRWFTPYEALRMATSENARLLSLSGPRNDYREGSLGVIEAGAYADVVLVDGNPLEDLDLVADPHTNFVVIMKDGEIYKNTLE